ncbi:LysE/ArgO family amino acid transporter [Paenibacillus soyae]|uniref:LysE family transporter n=1 Tax=Paenibacillus soyae TaxID=2969249 RepID=A0A9X2SBT6_9BACL|nr:LysE family transporter [Paenibacillus soyae]MCR2807994.1 LysE family transporter [Paenibacillus soyae]
MLEILFHGLLLGFGLILPLGVQNLFVFNQGANQPSYFRALPAIITASICDTILISIAVLGVSVVVFTFSWLKAVLYGFGFVFLIYMGWAIWRSEPNESASQRQSEPKKQILFAASVSLLNPHAIMDTIGVIGINSLNYSGAEKWMFTISIILVSWIWFFGLAFVGRQVVKLDSRGKFITQINKVSAIIIWGMAIYMGLSLFR